MKSNNCIIQPPQIQLQLQVDILIVPHIRNQFFFKIKVDLSNISLVYI